MRKLLPLLLSFVLLIGTVTTSAHGESVKILENSQEPLRDCTEEEDNLEDTIVKAKSPIISNDLSTDEIRCGLGFYSPPKLVIKAYVPDDGTLSYQWYSNNRATSEGATKIISKKNSTYIPRVDLPGTKYYACKVTNTLGNSSKSVWSSFAKIRVTKFYAEKPKIKEDLPTEVVYEINEESPSPIRITLETPSDVGELSYKWYKCNNGNIDDSDEISGETSNTFNPDISRVGKFYYFCYVENVVNFWKIDFTDDIYSNVVQVVVKPKEKASSPVLDNSLKESYEIDRGIETLKLNATSSVSDGGDISYQWYCNTEDKVNSAVKLKGETDPILYITESQPGDKYYFCKVKNRNNVATKQKVVINTVKTKVTTLHTTSLVTIDLISNKSSKTNQYYRFGEKVDIEAPERTGYKFKEWISDSKNVKFEDASSKITKITTPNEDVVIKATWNKIETSGAGGIEEPKNPKVNKIDIQTSNGITKAIISDRYLDTAISDAIERASEKQNSVNVIVDVSDKGESRSVEVELPVVSIKKLSDGNATLTVETSLGNITLNREVLKSTASNGEGNTAIIKLCKVDRDKLTTSHLNLVGTNDVFQVSIESNNKEIDKLEGNAIVNIPYFPAKKEDTNDLIIWAFKQDGTILPINCEYRDNKVQFTMEKFNKFVIASFPFEDVSGGNWYYQNIANMNNMGIMKGISSENFAPESTTTRGMVVTALYRANNKPDALDNYIFNDVSDNEYYSKAVSWASKNNIVRGVESDKFAPENLITREQMVAILYRSVETNIHGDVNLYGYADVDDISNYALDAFKWAIESGIVTGNTDGTLTLKGMQLVRKLQQCSQTL